MIEGLQRRENKRISPGFSCPLCTKTSYVAPYNYHQTTRDTPVYACSDCDFMFGRPAFIYNQDQRQMDSINDAELYESPLLKTLHRQLILKREIKKVRSYLGVGEHRLLDIGCGTGWTTRVWKEHGFDVTGLEPSSARREVAEKKYGVPVVGAYLEDAQIKEQFDVVVLRHIIEHFAGPFDLVRKASSFVAPGGVLLIIVPNINCLGRYLFDTQWTWVLPWHCNFFSPRSLASLVDRIDFQLVSSWQAPSPMYYHESFLRRFPYSIVRKSFELLGPVGMLLFSPLALVGLFLSLSDNLSVIAINKKQVG